METIIDSFLLDYGSYFPGITLTKTSSSTFTATASFNFTDADISPSFGSATNTTPFSGGSPVYGIGPTGNWNSRGGSEDAPVLDIIKDEVTAQYARPKQLIQMNISDIKSTGPVLNILGNFTDSLNQYGGSDRVFVFNRGELHVKKRIWNADLIEIL